MWTTLFLMRRNESQAVAGKLFGRAQSSVSRIVRRLRPLLRQATAELAGEIRQQAKRSAVLVDGFLAPTGNRRVQLEPESGVSLTVFQDSASGLAREFTGWTTSTAGCLAWWAATASSTEPLGYVQEVRAAEVPLVDTLGDNGTHAPADQPGVVRAEGGPS